MAISPRFATNNLERVAIEKRILPLRSVNQPISQTAVFTENHSPRQAAPFRGAGFQPILTRSASEGACQNASHVTRRPCSLAHRVGMTLLSRPPFDQRPKDSSLTQLMPANDPRRGITRDNSFPSE